MKFDDPNPKVVGADGHFTYEQPSICAVGLRPDPRNKGGFPVKVTLSTDPTHPVIIDRPGMYFQSTTFDQVTVDTTPGGGAAGDKWYLSIQWDSTDRITQFHQVDRDGYLLTRAGPARVLVDMDSGRSAEPFGALSTNGSFLITPDNRNSFTPSATPDSTPAWSLENLEALMFVVDQHDTMGTGLEWTLRAFCDLTHEKDGRTLATYAMGTVNNFGKLGATAWPGRAGAIHLGAGREASEALRTLTTDWAPFARLRLEVDANAAQLIRLSNPSDFRLRVRALGW